MTSKDKENKSLQDKLKQWLRKKGSHTKGAFELTEDIIRDLGKDSSNSTKIKRFKDVGEKIVDNKLETESIARLWGSIEYIFSPEQSVELRHEAFKFLQILIKNQYDELKLMRAQIFRFIKIYDNPEDITQRLHLLITLTNNGKIIQHFEEEVGFFLLNWFSEITKTKKLEDYLGMIVNVVKFNAVCLDGFVISGFIENVCGLCCKTTENKIVTLCLEILATIVAYSTISPEALPLFIGALCRTVNIEKYCQNSWKVTRDLLGTHMGHSALYTMCKILQEPDLKKDISLLRGAMCYIHMALWGKQLVPNLCCPPSSVLPSFLHAVKNNQPTIAYEAILGMQVLVNKKGVELQTPSWTIVLEIISHVNKNIEANPNQTLYNMIVSPLQETLNSIEKLIDCGKFNGSIQQFFNIIEECSTSRPEDSVLRLITYLSESITPTEHKWLINLNNLLAKYFKPDVRSDVRLKVLAILSNVVQLTRMIYEEDLIDCIIIPHTINIINDNDINVRAAVANILIDLCMSCESKRCLEMLDTLEKLLFRPYDHHLPDYLPLSEPDHYDVLCIVTGLIKVFTHKIHRLPSSHAIKIYNMLVHFLEMHYQKPKVFENDNLPRLKIFDCFLTMRADSLYHLGCLNEENKLRYSPYLCVTSQTKERGPMGSPPPQSPAITQQPQCTISYVPVRRAFKIFITCLKLEKDWEVLNLVLQEMPKVLQNKSLILSKYGNNELGLLVDILCSMISDKTLNLPESLNAKVLKVTFHSSVLLVLVSLPSYRSCLELEHQKKMVYCLTTCITNSLRSSPKLCIEALTICTLEMREVMVKMLPKLLLNLSKISATIYIASPVLEFLSTLTQLPMVFASFVDDEYMAVFAISFPYTNPFKYNHYTVSLAHYVIAVWFLKCRLPFRKNFVKFITSGLQTNILTPFEETNLISKTDLSKWNMDSSDRKRSSSLTEQGSKRRSATLSGRMDNISQSIPKNVGNRSILTFYEELTETCIDLMARYVFAPVSALPKRLPIAEFLLNGGQSMCWLVANTLVTVTTSGCSQKVLKHGLCDKCWTFCNTLNDSRSTGRKGSGENPESYRATRQNSNDKSNTNTSASSPIDENKRFADKLDQLPKKLQQLVSSNSDEKYEKPLCACWCQGWAEIYIRRPTGDMSWIVRVQNQISPQQSLYEFPLNDISTLFMPSFNMPTTETRCTSDRANSTEEVVTEDFSQSKESGHSSTVPISIPASPTKQPPSGHGSRDSVNEELEYIYDDGTRSRNPVRRSNSSPEMSNGKHPLLHSKQLEAGSGGDKNLEDDTNKKGKVYTKDMKVSCEAIPEEMAGTTPPSNDATLRQNITLSTHHPSLLSCHSYPGSSPPADSNIPPKPYQTVPPSPNVLSAEANKPSFPQKTNLTKSYKSDSLDSVRSDKVLERPNNLPNLSSLTPLYSKPPQSPTQTSPRLSRHVLMKDKEVNEIQKSASASVFERNLSLNLAKEKARERKSSGSVERLNHLDPNQAQTRDRSHTFSAMNSSSRKPRLDQLRPLNTRTKEAPKSGINPSFVFLQFYHRVNFDNSFGKPFVINNSEAIQRAVKILDLIPPYETHKIGILYIRENQCDNQVDILKNRFGSLRYVEFLQNLGTLIKLEDVDPKMYFLGGLDQSGSDGKFAYIWQDDVVKIIFHVATMMPNKETDPNCNNKKRHIGNNNVTIVYNESGEEYNIDTIKGQFNFASIIIHPLDHNINRVVVKCKKELNELIGSPEPKVVSDQNVAILARQLALHANLASLVHRSLTNNSQDPYASNWLERLRCIKRIRTKVQEMSNQSKDQASSYSSDESKSQSSTSKRKQMEDFTEYT